MDTEGYARGSHWYPGALPGLQEAGGPDSSDPQHSADSPTQQDSEVVTAFHAAVAAARLQAGEGQAQLADEGSAGHDQLAAPAAAQAASTPPAAMQGGLAGTAGPKASTPVPRRKGPGKLWQVSVGQDGQMEGCKGPGQVGRAPHVSGCCQTQCFISSVLSVTAARKAVQQMRLRLGVRPRGCVDSQASDAAGVPAHCSPAAACHGGWACPDRARDGATVFHQRS